MGALDSLSGLVFKNGDLAPHLSLGLGGKADYLALPKTREELGKVISAAASDGQPIRVLGSGRHVIVSKDSVQGVVLALSGAEFTRVSVVGDRVVAGAGAHLSSVVEAAGRAGLSGLEHLVGEPGTVAGALRLRVPEGEGGLVEQVDRIRAVSASGRVEELDAAMLHQGENRHDPFPSAIIVEIEFRLEATGQEPVVQRLKRCWIERRIREPLRANTIGPIFRGHDAVDLLRKSDVARKSEGCAEVSDRNPNFIVVRSPARPADIINLIEAMRQRVRERFHIDVERQISIW